MNEQQAPAFERLSEKIRPILRFRLSLNTETDRGAALMAAAFLDEALRGLLARRFIDDSKNTNELLRSSGPLGTFSSRIDLAFAIRLISSNVRRDLHLIRKIRNEFAHIAEPLDFSSPSIAHRCGEFYYDGYGDNMTVKPRSRFNRAVMGVLAAIDTAKIDDECREPLTEVDVIAMRKSLEEQLPEIFS